MHEPDASQLHVLLAESACRRLCHLYCRALDRLDEPLLRSLFHPDATHRHADFVGSSAEFCGYALEVVRGFAITQHLVGNTIIDVDGNVAHGETSFIAYHRAPAGVVGPFPAHDPARDEDCFVGGRYIDGFERRDGHWRIAHRHGVHDWERWAPTDSRMLEAIGPGGRGLQGRGDPLYDYPAGEARA